MRYKAQIAALLAAVCLLTGCGSTASEYQEYIQGSYDVIYKGEFTDYQNTTKATEEESKDQYEASVDHYVKLFAQKLDLDITEDAEKEKLETIVKKVLKLVKYNVLPAEKKDDAYYVEVKVEPLDYIDGVVDEALVLEAGMAEKMKSGAYTSEDAYKEEYQKGVFSILEDAAGQVSYGEEETFSIPIQVSGNTYYAEHEDLIEVTDYIFKVSE